MKIFNNNLNMASICIYVYMYRMILNLCHIGMYMPLYLFKKTTCKYKLFFYLRLILYCLKFEIT